MNLEISHSNRTILRTFQKVKKCTGLSNSDISHICGRVFHEDHQFLQLDLVAIDKFLEYINVDLGAFILDSFCYNTLAKQMKGDTLSLPEKSRGNLGSRSKTINNALSFFSNEKKIFFCRKFQLHQDLLKADGNRVSGRILGAAFKMVKRYHIDPWILYKVGQLNAIKYLDEFKGLIEKNMDPATAYDTLCAHTDIIEHNMSYRVIKSQKDSIIFESRPKEATRELLDKELYCDQVFSENIAGFLSGFSTYKGGGPLKVEQISGGLESGGVNRFEIFLH